MDVEDPIRRWVEVWVDAPGVEGCYTYALPATLEAGPGDLLTVPFGPQTVGAVALRILSEPPPELAARQIRSVEDVVSGGLLPASFWPLLERVSTYYCTAMPQVLRTALPAGILSRSQRRIRLDVEAPDAAALSAPAQALLQALRGSKRQDLAWVGLRRRIPQATKGLSELLRKGLVSSYWQETDRPQPKQQQAITLLNADPVGLSAPQQELLSILSRLGGDLLLTELLEQSGSSRQALQTLAKKGRVRISERQVLRKPCGPAISPDRPQDPTPEQAAAIAAILKQSSDPQLSLIDPGGRRRFLLWGVTGSGKTEVYLQVIAQVLAAGRSALVLVPEIGLTPQLTDRFRARFGSGVLVYHSDLSQGERFDAWRQMLGSQPQVVIGTRSAIFAPLPQLGLIVLDEEHDDSYKQNQPMPCYHARTVAEWRADLEGCPLVLGSATPALETYAAPLQHLRLGRRIQSGSELPPIELVDLREELAAGNRSVFSQRLRQAIDEVAAAGQQGILFVPRRGYSTFVSCRSCGQALTCPHCDVSLTFHQVGQRLRCHYCGYTQRHPDRCPHCASPYLKHFGNGTQKVEETLAAQWPNLRILRFDSDTTSRKGSHRHLLEQFRRGEADLLVGTQMLTKGLDVPQVTLVGVVAADGLLNLADFRASERAFQTLTQVAGRAGRGSLPGRAIIQTYLPEHPTLQAVCRYDYEAFLQQELHYRQDSGYPPARALIVIRCSSQDPDKASAHCATLAEKLGQIPGELLGPCPAQIERVNGWYRWQILLKEDPQSPWDRAALSRQLRALNRSPDLRLNVDVDPLQIL